MIKTGKKFSLFCIIGILFVLMINASIIYYTDPFFHYHKPYDWISYTLNNQRYQNNGILRNFDYDAIITGTSMVENFRTSEFDKIFDAASVKTCFSGASYKEINDNLSKALSYNPKVKYIVRCLDSDKILDSYDYMKDFDYPIYLYDDLLYNDVNYVLNKTVFFNSAIQTIEKSIDKKKSTTFDDYSAWYKRYKFGKEEVLKTYSRINQKNEVSFSDSKKENINKTITQNVTDLASQYPTTNFYIFFPPYSIYYWDGQLLRGTLKTRLEAIEYAMSLLVEYDNIHVYSFMNEYDFITNLDNYKDFIHYSEKINSQMLIWMKEGHDLITKDNYKDYMQKVIKYYTEFNYDSLEVK